MNKITNIVLAGISGSGKDTLAGRLESIPATEGNPVISRALTATTRPCGATERHGIDYYFLSDDVFDRIKAEGGFAETAEYNVCGEIWKYGSLLKDYTTDDGVVRLFILNPYGIRQLKKRGVKFTLVYLKIPFSVSLERMISRGRQTPEQIARRLAQDADDFADFEQEFAPDIVLDGTESETCVAAKLLDELRKKGYECISSVKADCKTASGPSKTAGSTRRPENKETSKNEADLFGMFLRQLLGLEPEQARGGFSSDPEYARITEEIKHLAEQIALIPLNISSTMLKVLDAQAAEEIELIKSKLRQRGYDPEQFTFPEIPSEALRKRLEEKYRRFAEFLRF